MTSENQEPNQQKPSEPAKDENSEIFSLDNIDDSWLDETDVFTRDKDGQVKRKPKPQPKPGGAPPPPGPGQNANVPSKPAAPPPPPMAAHRIASTSHDRAVKPAQPPRPPQPAQPPPPPQPAQPAQQARSPQPSQSAPPPQPAQPVQPAQPAQSAQPVRPPQPAQPPQPVQPAQPAQQAQPAQPAPPAELSPKEKGKITGEINLPPGVPQSRVTPPSIKEASDKPASGTTPAVAKKQEIIDERVGYHYWVEKSDHMKVHGQYLPFGSRSKTNEEVLEAEAKAASAASVGVQTAVADAPPPPPQPPQMVQAPELPDALAAIAAPSALSPGGQDQSTSNYMSDLLSGVNQVIDEKSIPPELKDSSPLTAESEKPNVQGFESPVVESPVSPAESPLEDKEQEPSTESEAGESEQVPEQEVIPVADLYSKTQSEVGKPVVRGPETRVAEQAPEESESGQEEPQAVPTEPSPSRVPHINQGSQIPLAAIVAGLVVVGIIVGVGLYQLKEFTSQKPKEQATTKLNAEDGSASGDTVSKTTKEPQRTTPMERWEKDFEKGQKFFSSKQYDNAVVYFSTAIAENPKKFEILHLRGKAYAKQKDYEHAIQDYTKALKLSKDNELVLLDRAAAYVYTDNLRRALRDYSRLLRVNPENSKASYGRALVRVKQKKYSAALKDFQNTVDSDPNYSNAYLQMGRIYAADDKNEEAIEAFTKAVRIRKTPELYYERSLAKYHQGQYQSAIDDLTAAISMERDNKEYYNDRGYIFLKLGRKVEAREDFSKALKIDPSYDLANQNMKKLENSF